MLVLFRCLARAPQKVPDFGTTGITVLAIQFEIQHNVECSTVAKSVAVLTCGSAGSSIDAFSRFRSA